MANIVCMPKQGLQMTEGTITRWLVREGETVSVGQPLFEMETDKLTITIDSPYSGTLLKILHPAGDTVPIARPIAVIGKVEENFELPESGEKPFVKEKEPPAVTPSTAEKAFVESSSHEGGRIFATPRAKTLAQKDGVDIEKIQGTGPDGLIIERDVRNVPKVTATPVAKKLAQKEGIDLSAVEGSGSRGKIMKSDIRDAGTKPSDAEETIVEFKGMRKAISDNMMQSLHNSAQANHKIRVDMTQAGLIRQAYRAAGRQVSYNDILIMALSHALMEHPYMNATVVDGKIYIKHYVNMGVAVAVDNGLIVPTIFGTHTMSLDEIHKAAEEKIRLARSGGLSKSDYSGGTFTISNLGMFGLDEFTAILNPPQVGILAVGAIVETPVVQNGQITVRPMVTLSLTYDHRAVDGAPAAKFLQRLKELLETPYLFLIL